MSTTLAKVQHKGAVIIPTQLRTQAGIAEGDIMEVSLHKGRIVLVPKMVIDRFKVPNADGEYNAAQRRGIDARLAKSDADIKHGRVYGPFATAKEMAASIESTIKKQRAPKKKGKAVSAVR